MNLFTEQLEDLAEPHTPRWRYHCRQCPLLGLLAFSDDHFKTGHPGKDANCLRIRCKGTLCPECLKMPASQEYEEPPIDTVEESAPKKTHENQKQKSPDE